MKVEEGTICSTTPAAALQLRCSVCRCSAEPCVLVAGPGNSRQIRGHHRSHLARRGPQVHAPLFRSVLVPKRGMDGCPPVATRCFMDHMARMQLRALAGPPPPGTTTDAISELPGVPMRGTNNTDDIAGDADGGSCRLTTLPLPM